MHAYYQFRKNDEKQKISEILDLTLSNYGEVIDEIRRLGINPCVYSVPPTATVGNEYNFPFYATPELRCEITRIFNEKLRELCRQNDYTYIDVYSKASDENGMMLQEYAGDEIHLNSRAVDLVKMELSEKLGIRFD
ncbi:MAG: SGNH/GDSL hydrolase family protein [Dehalococcoidia bacterium]